MIGGGATQHRQNKENQVESLHLRLPYTTSKPAARKAEMLGWIKRAAADWEAGSPLSSRDRAHGVVRVDYDKRKERTRVWGNPDRLDA